MEVDEPGYTCWSITPATVTLACEPTIEIVNRQCPKGSIVVTKTGLESGDLVSITLKKGIATIETKTDVGNGVYTFSNLPVGSDYSITETYTSGNIYTYAAATQTPGNPLDVADATPVDVSLVNNPEKGSIEIFKTDATSGLPLGGSTFELQKWGSWITIDTVFLGPDGHYKWEGLPYGLYRVVETIAPTGYLLAPPIEVTLNGETPDVTLLEEIADPRIPGRVTIIKTDPGGALLDGAGFTIYYKASGNPVMPERFTSGGLVTFSGLAWGTYIIAETTPPAGYDASDPVEVTIDAFNAEAGVTVTRINTPTTTTTTITTLGIASPGGIEVLGIQELPFTGLNPLIPISGLSTIFAGGLMVALSAIRKRFGKK